MFDYANHLIQLLLPMRCVFCGVPHKQGPVCEHCSAVLPRIEVICEHCGQPLPAVQPSGVVCADCQLRPPIFIKARAPFTYDFPIDSALKALKFKQQLWHAPALAGMLLAILEQEFSACDALVPVPLHRTRHALRGFNQATELCRTLRRTTNLPIVRNAFRYRATRSQAGLTAAERKKNVKGAFGIKGNFNYRHPVIVDDVITTGATCEQLASALLNAGAEQVGVLTVARVQPG